MLYNNNNNNNKMQQQQSRSGSSRSSSSSTDNNNNNNTNITTTTVVEQFFIEWDAVERVHPWGVVALSPFLSGFGISSDVCEEVDGLIFVDLMIQRQIDVRHLKVEGRGSSATVFWVVVELRYPNLAIVSFQLNPVASLQRSMVVAASPGLIVACIVALYRWAIGSSSSCNKNSVRCRRSMMMMMQSIDDNINNNYNHKKTTTDDKKKNSSRMHHHRQQ